MHTPAVLLTPPRHTTPHHTTLRTTGARDVVEDGFHDVGGLSVARTPCCGARERVGVEVLARRVKVGRVVRLVDTVGERPGREAADVGVKAAVELR